VVIYRRYFCEVHPIGEANSDHEARPTERCDASDCGRAADVIQEGRRWCSWHWAEHRSAVQAGWAKPSAKAG
jgi:hypothetical protein